MRKKVKSEFEQNVENFNYDFKQNVEMTISEIIYQGLGDTDELSKLLPNLPLLKLQKKPIMEIFKKDLEVPVTIIEKAFDNVKHLLRNRIITIAIKDIAIENIFVYSFSFSIEEEFINVDFIPILEDVSLLDFKDSFKYIILNPEAFYLGKDGKKYNVAFWDLSLNK